MKTARSITCTVKYNILKAVYSRDKDNVLLSCPKKTPQNIFQYKEGVDKIQI